MVKATKKLNTYNMIDDLWWSQCWQFLSIYEVQSFLQPVEAGDLPLLTNVLLLSAVECVWRAAFLDTYSNEQSALIG
jgi:hypothetical protein